MTLKTRVLFVEDSLDGRINAVFPDLMNGRYYIRYAHTGVHSHVHKEWVEECSLAEDYSDLQDELMTRGYDLHVMNNDLETAKLLGIKL
jgi:hypothetical protein